MRDSTNHNDAKNELAQRVFKLVGDLRFRGLQEFDLDDVRQKTLMRVLAKMEKCQIDPEKLAAYVGRAFKHHAINHLNELARRLPQFDEAFESPPAMDSHDAERIFETDPSLLALDERQRQVLILSEIDKRPLREIGQILGCSTTSAFNLKKSALNHIRAAHGALHRPDSGEHRRSSVRMPCEIGTPLLSPRLIFAAAPSRCSPHAILAIPFVKGNDGPSGIVYAHVHDPERRPGTRILGRMRKSLKRNYAFLDDEGVVSFLRAHDVRQSHIVETEPAGLERECGIRQLVNFELQKEGNRPIPPGFGPSPSWAFTDMGIQRTQSKDAAKEQESNEGPPLWARLKAEMPDAIDNSWVKPPVPAIREAVADLAAQDHESRSFFGFGDETTCELRESVSVADQVAVAVRTKNVDDKIEKRKEDKMQKTVRPFGLAPGAIGTVGRKVQVMTTSYAPQGGLVSFSANLPDQESALALVQFLREKLKRRRRRLNADATSVRAWLECCFRREVA